MTDERPPIVCPACDGDRGFESAPYGYNHHDGSPLTHWSACTACDGKGEVPDDSEPAGPVDLSLEGFSADDIAEAAKYRTLGPGYFRAQRFMAGVVERMEADDFRPLVEKIVEQIQDALWPKVADHLLYDSESNAGRVMVAMVDDSVKALLTGDRWALERYPLAAYHDGQAIRRAIVEHCGASLIEKVERDEERERRSLAWQYRSYRRAA